MKDYVIAHQIMALCEIILETLKKEGYSPSKKAKEDVLKAMDKGKVKKNLRDQAALKILWTIYETYNG